MYTGAFVTISHRDCWLNCALEILLLQILLPTYLLTYLLTLLIHKRSRFKGNEKCLSGWCFVFTSISLSRCFFLYIFSFICISVFGEAYAYVGLT